jgi:hypothetical protein
MGGRIGRKGPSLRPLLCIHGTAWVHDCRPSGASICLFARIHETPWASAIPGWIDPLPRLPATMGPHDCPRRAERYTLPVHADTHHGPWVCPWGSMATCLRATRSSMDPYGSVLPGDAGVPRADATIDPWQRMLPSAGRTRPWTGMDHRKRGIGTPNPTTRTPMRGDGYRDAGQRMAPCRGRLGPSSAKGARVRLFGVRIGGIRGRQAGQGVPRCEGNDGDDAWEDRRRRAIAARRLL